MSKWLQLIILMLIFICSLESYTNPSRNATFTLGSNIITNSNISTPVISPFYAADYIQTVAGWTTTGYYVEYIDPCLEIQQNFIACPRFHGVTCGWQFLDTDSNSRNQKYYQTFNLNSGQQYQLKFDWTSQISYLLLSTGISVIWNGNTVDSFYDNGCTLHTSTYYVGSVAGTNRLYFEGIGLVDSQGILIRNIRLQQIIYQNPVNSTNSSISNQNTTNTANISTNSSGNSSASSSVNSTNSSIDFNGSSSAPSSINATNSSDSFPTNTSNSTSTNDFSNINGSALTFDDLQTVINGSEYQNIFKFLNFMRNFQLVNVASSVFPSKQNMKFVLGFMLEFNHFLLYNFHLLNYTLMSNVILVGMMAIDDQKGLLVDQYIYPKLGTTPHEIVSEFKQQNELSVNMNNIVSDFSQRPNGVLVQIADLVFLDLPVTLVIFVIGYIFFRLLFHYRISVAFRQYSLFSYIFCILFDGKIEMITFFFLSEVLLLTSSCFKQKGLTVVIIFSYFVIFFFAVASMLVYRATFRNLLKYVYENCRKPLSSSFYMSFSFGLYNIGLGFLHRLLLQSPMQQLYLLIAYESLYLSFLLYLLFRQFYDNIPLALTQCAMNLSRLSFLITFLLFSFYPDNQYDISVVQQYIFYSFIILWGLSSLLCLLDKISVFYRIAKSMWKSSNRVSPLIDLKQVPERIIDPQAPKIFIFSQKLKSIEKYHSSERCEQTVSNRKYVRRDMQKSKIYARSKKVNHTTVTWEGGILKITKDQRTYNYSNNDNI